MILSEEQRYRLDLVTTCYRSMQSATTDGDLYWDDALEVAKFVYERDDSGSDGDERKPIKVRL